MSVLLQQQQHLIPVSLIILTHHVLTGWATSAPTTSVESLAINSTLPAVSDPIPPSTPHTTMSAIRAEDFYLWLPLIVVVLFTAIMIGLIVLGRRQDRANRTPAQTEAQTTTGDTEEGVQRRSNHGDAPDTPPPTYSMIERQTSYVSYISQTSSQCSIPPDYDEATQLPDADFNANRSGSRVARSVSGTRRPTRSSSGTGRSSSLRQLRARFLGRRSHSAIETRPSNQSRNSSHQSSVTSENGDMPDGSAANSDLSDVFVDTAGVPNRSHLSQSAVAEEQNEEADGSLLPSTNSEPADMAGLNEELGEEDVVENEHLETDGAMEDRDMTPPVEWHVGDSSGSTTDRSSGAVEMQTRSTSETHPDNCLHT